jgi:hypothetical protein
VGAVTELGIVAFLTRCLDEDEQRAEAWQGDGYDWREWQIVGSRKLTYRNGVSEIVTAIDVTNRSSLWAELIYVKSDIDNMSDHLVRHSPARVLADIAAKRAILAQVVPELQEHEKLLSYDRGGDGWAIDGSAMLVRLLVAPYADRPGFNPAWAVSDSNT